MLANVNVVTFEYASARRQDLCVALMPAGYPIGATVGGVAAVGLGQASGWLSVYVFCALVALLVPLTLVYLPESPDFLLARQPSNALAIFPAAIRATGTGFAMIIGRVGVVIGPLVAGLPMQVGYQRPVYCSVLAAPMLVAMACLYGPDGLDVPITPVLDQSAVSAA